MDTIRHLSLSRSTRLMEALVARSSVLSPAAVAGDASPSPSRIRVSVALPRSRRSPSTLAISTRWPRASPRRGGARLLAGSGEGGSLDPAGDAGGHAEESPLLENNVTLHESHHMDTTKQDEIGICGNGGSNIGGSRTGLFRTPISGGVHSATAVHDLPPPALAVRNLMEQARFAQLCTVMSRMHHRRAGYPFGSLVDFAPDPLGHPILSLSPLAIHTRNLLADPRCSLVVQITGSSGLSNTRVTIFGDVIPLPAEQQEWAHQQYVSKHQQWASQQWGNFYYYRMETISDIYFIGGFGTVAWIDVKEYESLQPDKISMDGGEQYLKEINSMFSKPLKELLSTEGEVDDVAVISMDSKGIDIRVRQGAQFNIQRIAFEVDRSVETLDEAKEALRRIISKSRWHTKSSILRRP
ncbi:hypothetical protein SEVIR_1G087200v4 [Setaria viridis]|uniref:CREG-like beta-barrel domain-containing protein n=3 Tax=Setaria TaxID=4554 RepID=A0A368PIB2_SETIT|nr:uncharacterized protein LOC101775837 [Setaria italica]XP_034587591.1 uncharacterized protein LOC117849948 [Setaria viridis]RCV05495.1 hypothetical protein SETIT_1G089200v2 [Setaria italica]TKW38007.1 hypothetical protein SEVIR_1G087200v2 [Setaria viridis]